MWVILVKIVEFVPYTTFWKTSLASSQRSIIIKYFAQLKFIYYHKSGEKNIWQDVCKFEVIGKWFFFLRIRQCSTSWQLWRVPAPRHVIWYQSLNLLLKVCVSANLLTIIFFFHSLTCCRYGSFKK